MAVTPAQAGYGTVDDTGETNILTSACMSIWIKCSSNSANSLLVCILELHGTDFLKLEAGDIFVARASTPSGFNNMATVAAKALDNSAVATISWGVCGEFAYV